MTQEAGHTRARTFADRNADQFGYVLLLVLGVFILGSVVRFSGWGAVLICVFGSFTALYALTSARAMQPVLRAGLVMAALSIAVAVVDAAGGGSGFDGGAAFLQMLLFLMATAAMLRGVVTDERVRGRTIAGAISVYVMLGLLFTYVYVGVDLIQGAFFGAGTAVHKGDFLFFSITTLTTTGYGDLVPVGQPGRMLASLEMLTGQIFVITLVARLVSMWRPGEWLREGAGIARRRHEHTDS